MKIMLAINEALGDGSLKDVYVLVRFVLALYHSVYFLSLELQVFVQLFETKFPLKALNTIGHYSNIC